MSEKNKELREAIIDVHVLQRHVPFSILLGILVIALGVFAIVLRGGSILPGPATVFERNGGDDLTMVFGSWPALQGSEFFNDVKSGFVKNGVDFIEGDLSEMKLRVYRKGAVVKEAAILSKGREGSWWETPAGLYRVESKERNHFSSFGRVYQPWSLAFQGNFFIHGWPYYPGGQPVPSGYSGGCIRLSGEDAREVFDLAKVGIPVLIFEKDFVKDQFTYDLSIPDLTAKSYLAADLKSNFVLVENNSKQPLPIASITKLMTALVATEYVNVEKEVLITKKMLVPTSVPRLTTSTSVSLYNLLFPLLMESSNEAAEAIGSLMPRETMTALMNQKAKAIGMSTAHFTDLSGADSGNVASAQDLFNLAKYLYNNRSFLLKISAGKLKGSVYGASIFKDLKNLNIFYNHPDFIGGKVGMTSAAQGTNISLFEFSFKDTTRPLVLIVLGSPSQIDDSVKFLTWLRINY